jgi:hypothetical protein
VITHPAAASEPPVRTVPVASSGLAISSSDDGRTIVDTATTSPDAGASFVEMRRLRIELASFAGDRTRDDELEVWVVEPGDHLWSIAAETLTEHLGELPSERRVARYWQRLIAANADRFVVPGQPDVIMPGQRLALPRPAQGRVQRSGT